MITFASVRWLLSLDTMIRFFLLGNSKRDADDDGVTVLLLLARVKRSEKFISTFPDSSKK